jgi:uncharacterized membrane protein YdfJ with MMPL/SSD domain
MSNATKVIVAIVVVAVVGAGAALVFGKKDENKNSSSQTSGTSQTTGQSQSEQNTDEGSVASTITYNGSSFSVSASSVDSGSKVKIVNDSSEDLDFNSDPHPVHTDNPELNAGDIAPGDSTAITLTTKGTWGFHNHLNSSQHGEITVQ